MYPYLYKITDQVTPLKYDCGLLCNSICCRPDHKDALGIYLYPGEEKMFLGQQDWLDWEKHDRDEQFFPPSWPRTIYFIRCTKSCPRELRPLACRFFPLAPHITPNDELQLIYETLALPYDCTLIKNRVPLQQKFIDTVAHCWDILLTDYRLRDLIEEYSRDRDVQNEKIEVIWNKIKFDINA